MKNQNKIRNLIRRTRDRLSWPLTEITKGDTLEIVSDHWHKTHRITWPKETSPAGAVRDIEYLHELAHAVLCETVHPMFSTHYFVAGYADNQLRDIAPAIRAANDWFADEWLMKRCPQEEGAEIAEHFALVKRRLERDPSGSVELLYGAALIIAQAIHYFHEDIPCGGQLGDLIQAMLAIPPGHPTIENLETLTNKLIAATSNIQLARVKENGVEIWKIC